ncbi:MAG: hypothetical protein EOP10_33270 [Proteobacteria bacterium]|nr:MAG: hypothetical protein EOP10_33270 [Pseudomonadota bacterium]
MTDDIDPSAFLVGFLSKFTLLIEHELLSIRQSVVGTVEAVMQGIETISIEAEKNKLDAEQILEFTYLHPDPETEILLDDIQKLADEVIDSVYRQVEDGSSTGSVTSTKSEVLVQNRLNRFSSKLDESKGRLAKFDDKISSTVFSIVGALSAEDLIAQRLEHTILSLKSLQTGLSFILIDYEERCRSEEIQNVVKSILDYTYRQYTTEEEKDRFTAIFGKVAA